MRGLKSVRVLGVEKGPVSPGGGAPTLECREGGEASGDGLRCGAECCRSSFMAQSGSSSSGISRRLAAKW